VVVRVSSQIRTEERVSAEDEGQELEDREAAESIEGEG
jgi:hypothetical protein